MPRLQAPKPPPVPELPSWLTGAAQAAAPATAAKQTAKTAEQPAKPSGPVDTETTWADVKSAAARTPGEFGKLVKSMPAGLIGMGKMLLGSGTSAPADWAKKAHLGLLAQVPIVGAPFSKTFQHMAESAKATGVDVYRIMHPQTGKYNPETKRWEIKPSTNADRITQAVREGRSPVAPIVEDAGNLMLLGSAAAKAFSVQARVAEAGAARATAAEAAAATPEEQAAAASMREASQAKATAARQRQAAAKDFEHIVGKVGASPMYPYIYGIKGTKWFTQRTLQWWAEAKRAKADNLDAAGDNTGKAQTLRNTADAFNRLVGKPVVDANGDPVMVTDPKTGKQTQQMVERPAVIQWAKDRIRQTEAKIAKVTRQGLAIFQRPFNWDQINPETQQPYGPLSDTEQAAVFAIRNGRSTLLRFVQDAVPDISLQEIVDMGSRSRIPGYSLPDEAAQMAVDYERGTLDLVQRQRLDQAVKELNAFVEQYLGMPRRKGEGTQVERKPGEIVTDPLDPYQDMPVPHLDRFRQALRNMPGNDPQFADGQFLADILDNMMELGLGEMAVNDPQRINIIAGLVDSAPDSVVGNLDIWPAKERNRVNEIMMIREGLRQRGATTVIGRPMPPNGPGGGAQPLTEDPTTGLPTVDDIVGQRLPGEAPRLAMPYMRRSWEALQKLRGRAAALAQQIVDAQVAIDGAERTIASIHWQLKEIEGTWVNNRGREVFPDPKTGQLPKSARRVPGLLELAKQARDEQLALYNEMVAKQLETTTVDGVEVSREDVAASVESINQSIDDMQAQVDAGDQAAAELSAMSEELMTHNSNASMALADLGVDPETIRSAINADLELLPADPTAFADMTSGDEVIDSLVQQRNGLDYQLQAASGLAEHWLSLSSSIEDRIYELEFAVEEGTITPEEARAAADLLDEQNMYATAQYQKYEAEAAAKSQAAYELKIATEEAIAKRVKAMPEEARTRFAAQLQRASDQLKQFDKLYGQQIKALEESLASTRSEWGVKGSKASNDYQIAQAKNHSPNDVAVEEVSSSMPVGNSTWDHAYVMVRGLRYRLTVLNYKKGWVSIVRLDHAPIDRSLQPNYEYSQNYQGISVTRYEMPEARELAKRASNGELPIDDPQLIAIMQADAAKVAASNKQTPEQAMATFEASKNAADEVVKASDGIWSSLRQLRPERRRLANQQAFVDRMQIAVTGEGSQKIVGYQVRNIPVRVKLSGVAKSVFEVESQIDAIDKAVEHYDKTGNWLGAVYGVSDQQLGVNSITNIGGESGPGVQAMLNSSVEEARALRDRALEVRDTLEATTEQVAGNASPKVVGELAKGNTNLNARPVADPLDGKQWVKGEDGTRTFETGTRTYHLTEEPRPGGTGKQKDFKLVRIGSDGKPIESTRTQFKTFAAVRKYVAETMRVDAEMANNYDVPYPRLMLEAPKTPPFPQQLIEAEARLAKVEGRRVSLLRDLNTKEKQVVKARVNQSKRLALMPKVTGAATRLEARLGREIITQPGVTEVNGIPAPVEPALGARLRPTEINVRQPGSNEQTGLNSALEEEMAKVAASLGEANLRRAQQIPISMAMRASMSRGREIVGMLDGEPVYVQGSGYVPAETPSTAAPGMKRRFQEGFPGRRKLKSQYQRAGTNEEIYNVRSLIKRAVSEQRQMSVNESMAALMFSKFALSAVDLLGPALVNDIRKKAEEYVLNNIRAYQPGNPGRDAYYRSQVAQEIGKRIREEMANRGWETNPGTYKGIETSRPDTMIDENTRFLPRYVRDAVAQRIEYVDPNAIGTYLKIMGKTTSTFKALTLPLSITWQLGDIITNFIVAKMTDVPIRDLIKQMNTVYEANYGGGWKEIFKAEQDRKVNRLGQILAESGVQDVGLRLEERSALQGLDYAQTTPVSHRIPGLGVIPRGYGWLRERSYRLNEFTNRLGRQGYFLAKLQNALDEYNLQNPSKTAKMEDIIDYRLDQTVPEIGRLFWDTVNQANDVMGDWMDLTPYERRVIMPHVTFYAWIKHINKLFYRIAMNDPAKIMWYMYIGQMGYNEDTDPFGLMAGWARGISGGLSNLQFLSPFTDVVNGPIANLVTPILGGQPEQASLAPLGTVFSPGVRFMAAATGHSLRGGFTSLGRPAGTGAITSSGQFVDPQILAPNRLGELAGFTVETFPLLRKLADLAPTMKLPGTQVQLGPYKTYETGYARTTPGTNIKIEKPGGRMGALLNLFNVPFRTSKTDQQVLDERLQAIKNLRSFDVQQIKLRAFQGG